MFEQRKLCYTFIYLLIAFSWQHMSPWTPKMTRENKFEYSKMEKMIENADWKKKWLLARWFDAYILLWPTKNENINKSTYNSQNVIFLISATRLVMGKYCWESLKISWICFKRRILWIFYDNSDQIKVFKWFMLSRSAT